MRNKVFEIKENQHNSISKTYVISDVKKRNNFFHVETQDVAVSLYPEAMSYAHSHDFYTIICFLEGEGSLLLDFNEYKVKPYTIFFIPPGQLHQFKYIYKISGINFYFSEDFLCNMSRHVQNIIAHEVFSDRNIPSICHIRSEELNRIIEDYEKIKYRYENPVGMETQNDYLASLLSVFLFDVIDCSVWEKSADNTKNAQAYQLYLEFMANVEQNFKCIHAAEYYAELMNVTLNTLSRSVSEIRDKTPCKLINERLVLEAKRMLFEHPEMRIKEIANELGFSDNSNFAKFFKHNAGISPIVFRESV